MLLIKGSSSVSLSLKAIGYKMKGVYLCVCSDMMVYAFDRSCILSKLVLFNVRADYTRGVCAIYNIFVFGCLVYPFLQL